MARKKKPIRSRKGNSRKSTQRKLTKRQIAARKGWKTRRANERKRSELVIVPIEGPHGRAALSMDWNGSREEIKALAQQVKKQFPDAKAWQFAFRFRFVPDVEKGDGEERWVSIPFGSDFKSQLVNAIDYASVFTSGQMNYGIVIPLAATVVVQE